MPKAFLASTAAVVALAATLASAATPLAATTASESLAPGVDLIRGAFVEGRQPDGNTVLFEAPEGLVVVDTGRHAAHTQRILDFAAERRRPVAAIVNTHWHLDHIGGNSVLRGAHPGAKLVASGAIAGARGGFLARYRSQLEKMVADPATEAAAREEFRLELARIDGSAALDADVVVGAGDDPRREIGGLPVELHVAPGATDGDLWIFDRRHGILVAGDLVTLPAPFFDTACPRRWQESLGALAATEFRTLVPGHGPPMDREGFTRYRRAFDGLLACAATDGAPETCVDGWLAAATGLVATGDEPLARGLVGYYLGILRDPARQSCQDPA
jgi:glyoxylase-like metal-dependent hydrolase (beta-lactamase superfamily II)